ncbi:MAG: thioredoxin family protein [Planctomycetes bacterium]|nr:thioredoxin family protein [Planctomycetota bacterium]
MVRTESTMLALGTSAADFDLPDTQGRRVRLADFGGSKALVVMFLSNHCPFVQHVLDGLVALVREYQPRGVAFVAIASNDIGTHPQDGPAEMAKLARAKELPYPYLFDASQEVAKAYRAACTPDFFVFDGARQLAYRGQLDSARPGNAHPVDGADLRAALDSLLSGRPAVAQQRASVGCNIKWRPGNEPEWFPR